MTNEIIDETQTKYLSLAEASRIFGIPQNYLNVLIHRNKIEGKKFGRNWYTTEETIRLTLIALKLKNQ